MQVRLLTIFAVLVLQATGASAQTAQPAQPASAPGHTAPIAYPSVAAALKALQARDGDGTVVVHTEGWVIVNEPRASAQWSFTPKGHAAYPAVVRRVIEHGPGGAVAVDVASLCEAPKAECDKLVEEFNGMNERIVQALKARGRSGSSRAMQLPQPTQQ